MNQRYAKQIILPEIGPDGQRRLDRGRVLCVGAGGLGCAVLPYLAGAGVGRITIIDPDRVDRTNLQRQVLFGESDLGQLKAEVAARRLADLNPEIELIARPERLDSDNVESLFRDHDLVIDGSDNFATKYLVGDASVKFDIPLVYGSATGMEALVTVFAPRMGPCLRCLFPQAPTGWVPNCAEAGVLGPLVGAAGCVQAAEAIKWLAGNGQAGLQSLAGHLWTMDARDMNVRRLAVRRRPDCPTCSRPSEEIKLQPLPALVAEIDFQDLDNLEKPVLVDVREIDEYQANHLPSAINRPLSALRAGACKLPEAGVCVLYCASGGRSREAISLLGKQSGRSLLNLRGGLQAAGPVADPGEGSST
jgi:sulfur-carrier protein adenylyltransferase/sulfurtransferase